MTFNFNNASNRDVHLLQDGINKNNRIQPNHGTYPYKNTVKQFCSVQI